MAAESPIFDESSQSELFEKNKPENKPRDDERLKKLRDYSEQIQLILQTVNTNEYQAALTYMKPPNANFSKAVKYPAPGMVVGKFADIKTALIRTKPGREVARYIQDAIKAYPNAVCVIGVGVCYAFNKKDYKLADVLVSDRICDFVNSKFNNGEVENRGPSIPLIHELEKIFTLCPEEHTGINVSGDRKAKVASGTFCCSTFLVNDEDQRDKFYEAIKDQKPIGGEMEGGELIRFDRQKKIEGVIVIKGVADYADGGKTKEWQFTAAMAALEYTESQLHESDWGQLFPEKVSTTPMTSPYGSTVPPRAVSMTPNGSTSATPSSRVAADSDQDVTGNQGSPTLPRFINFPTADGEINLAERIGTDYQNFGILLLEDDHGELTAAAVKKHLLVAEDINKDIFQQWLGGKGRKPVSWDTLVQVLRDMKQHTLAGEVSGNLTL